MASVFDCAVVGAGVVGSAVALGMARAGLTVALIEASDEPTRRAKDDADGAFDLFDLKVSALAPRSLKWLEMLGVLQEFASDRIYPYSSMRVWDSRSGANIDFDARTTGRTILGWIAEQRELMLAMNRCLTRAPGITQIRPAALTSFRMHGDQVSLSLDSEGASREIGSRLMVGADGARSRVRELFAIPASRHEYRQAAVVTYARTERPHRQRALQHFLSDGPLALLPLEDHWSAVVWTMRADQAPLARAWSAEQFCAALADASEYCLGAVREIGPRAAFTLQHLQAERYIGPRVALVGDAAHVIHPLAGQGVNLGLTDATELCRVVSSHYRSGRDIGREANLRAFERRRRYVNRTMGESMSILNGLFGSNLQPLRWARRFGVGLSQHCPPLKRWFMRVASGDEY